MWLDSKNYLITFTELFLLIIYPRFLKQLVMKRANTAPVPAIQNDHQVVSDDATPKGRYKSALLSPLQGLPSSSTLAPGFLHSFGFAKTTASSDAGMFASA